MVDLTSLPSVIPNIKGFATVATIIANFFAVWFGVRRELKHNRELEEQRKDRELERQKEELGAILAQFREEISDIENDATDIQDAIQGNKQPEMYPQLDQSAWEAHREEFIRIWRIVQAEINQDVSNNSLPIELTEFYTHVEEANKVINSILNMGYAEIPMSNKGTSSKSEAEKINRHHNLLLERLGEIIDDAENLLNTLEEEFY